MDQRKARGVQRLPRKRAERRCESRAAPRGKPPATAVHRVTHDRIPDVRQVYADLVSPSGLELHPYQRVGAITLDDAVVSHGFASIASHRHARALCAVTPDWRIDRPAT